MKSTKALTNRSGEPVLRYKTGIGIERKIKPFLNLLVKMYINTIK